MTDMETFVPVYPDALKLIVGGTSTRKLAIELVIEPVLFVITTA